MESGARIVLVEDDPTVRTVVADHLRAAGGVIRAFADGPAALGAVQDDVPDLVIVDRMLPGMDGTELCRRIRAISAVPVIMLTALGSVDDRISGLESGADDYLSKPFSLRELQLRVNVQLRRNAAAQPPLTFVVDPFRVDPAHRRVWLGDREIALTTREYELFLYLVRNPGRVVSREEILREVWQWAFGEPSTVTVHVRRLREKIEPDPRIPTYLHTEWGAGYRFRPAGAVAC